MPNPDAFCARDPTIGDWKALPNFAKLLPYSCQVIRMSLHYNVVADDTNLTKPGFTPNVTEPTSEIETSIEQLAKECVLNDQLDSIPYHFSRFS